MKKQSNLTREKLKPDEKKNLTFLKVVFTIENKGEKSRNIEIRIL